MFKACHTLYFTHRKFAIFIACPQKATKFRQNTYFHFFLLMSSLLSFTCRCGEMSWVDWKLPDLDSGYMYCCAVEDAVKAIPAIPSLETAGLLGADTAPVPAPSSNTCTAGPCTCSCAKNEGVHTCTCTCNDLPA